MEREEMIARICERLQEADMETLEEFLWYLEGDGEA